MKEAHAVLLLLLLVATLSSCTDSDTLLSTCSASEVPSSVPTLASLSPSREEGSRAEGGAIGASDEEERHKALSDWRRKLNRKHRHQQEQESGRVGGDEPRKVLVVDINFGGLSNRRQSLMYALEAARLLNRSLVLGEHFDDPFPTSFGPCMSCVRPLGFYFNISVMNDYAAITSYEKFFSRMEARPSARTYCKGVCFQRPPPWLQDAEWDGSITNLQGPEDFKNLEPIAPADLTSRFGDNSEEIVWIDTSFRLVEVGRVRAIFDGNERSRALQARCSSCISRCHSAEFNPIVKQNGWCDSSCRRECQKTCTDDCQVSRETLTNASKLPTSFIPEDFLLLLAHVRYSNKLELTAERLRRRMRGTPPAQQHVIDNDESKDFICAHWRTGDWSFPLSPEALVTAVTLVMEEENISFHSQAQEGRGLVRGLFLASDATEEQRELVAEKLPLLDFGDGMRSVTRRLIEEEAPELVATGEEEEQETAGEREDSILNAILEQLVCAKGVVFIGTRRSTFTETIVEERVRNGFLTGSNYLVP